MNPNQEMMDSVFRERVLAAREIPIGEKLLGGARLFDEASERMRAGIRSQFPEMSEDEVREEFRRRLRVLRKVSDHGYYRDVEVTK